MVFHCNTDGDLAAYTKKMSLLSNNQRIADWDTHYLRNMEFGAQSLQTRLHTSNDALSKVVLSMHSMVYFRRDSS